MVTRLWYEIYKRRADLRSVFPDVLGVHREAFLKWIREKNLDELGVDPCFLPGALPPTDRPPHPNREVRCDAAAPFGVNVLGYFHSEKGVGEAARADIRSLEAAGIPHVLNNFADQSASNVEKVGVCLAEENPYKINLFHVNADQVPVLFQQKKENFAQRYNIGYWNWELSDFPLEWQPHFRHFNEIWVPTAFVKDAVARVSPIPVFSVPYALNPEPAIGRGWTRARFGLSPESFVFLFFFDFYSVMERKNPLGLVRAFREAFGDRADVVLFIKCSHSECAPEETERLRQACQGSNLKVQDAVWPREAINALLATCDCYVSLHRSEGFGLTLAEAMYLGKPVIATAYSGNMDFMREDNSFLVRYKSVKLEKDYGPYKKGCVWAEPDLEQAAELMRHVYEHRQATASVAARGQETVSDAPAED